MKRRDLLNHLRRHGCRLCVKVATIRFGKTRLRIVVPRCRVIERFLITQQGESVGNWVFLCRKKNCNSVSPLLFSDQWIQG